MDTPPQKKENFLKIPLPGPQSQRFSSRARDLGAVVHGPPLWEVVRSAGDSSPAPSGQTYFIGAEDPLLVQLPYQILDLRRSGESSWWAILENEMLESRFEDALGYRQGGPTTRPQCV